MPPKARAAAAKPRARKPAKVPGVLQLDRPENTGKVEKMIADREPLFYIGDTAYTIPKAVPPQWSLEAFDIAFNKGEQHALAYAVTKMLEPQAYEALKACESLTPDDLATLFRAIFDKVLPDGQPVPKASQPSGTGD